MTVPVAVEDVETLRSRLDAVRAIRASPGHKASLEATLDVSRSTVTRAVRELEDAGLVHRTDNGYELTCYGEALYERYASFLTEAEEIVAARPLLRALSAATPVSYAFLADATVCRSRSPAPYAPLSRIDRLLESSRRLSGIVRHPLEPETVSHLFDRVESGLRGHLVADHRAIEYVYDRHDAGSRLAREVDGFETSVTEAVPYTLLCFEGVGDATTTDDTPLADGTAPAPDAGGTPDDEGETTGVDDRTSTVTDGADAQAVLVVFDEHGDFRGTIANDTPAAVTWARELIDAARTDARPIGDWFTDRR